MNIDFFSLIIFLNALHHLLLSIKGKFYLLRVREFDFERKGEEGKGWKKNKRSLVAIFGILELLI